MAFWSADSISKSFRKYENKNPRFLAGVFKWYFIIRNNTNKKTPGLGLEPRLNAPEALVLPLHHPGIKIFPHLYSIIFRFC